MELFQTDDHYIVQDGQHSLWCSRSDGKLDPQEGSALANAWNPVCLGTVDGVIGKIKVHPDSSWRLLLISGQRLVGSLPGGHHVYCITRIAILPLSESSHPDIDIERCSKHHFGMKKTKMIMKPATAQQKALTKTWNSIKAVTQVRKKEVKEREKHERRITEELLKMFTDSEWFYYTRTGDLTNTLQRQHTGETKHDWDERFFWNQHMLQDIFACTDKDLAGHWTVPIIQGYVSIRACKMIFEEEDENGLSSSWTPEELSEFKLILISRRSKHRAGTRYRRRGIDGTGACANYVETEQIIQTREHSVSFVQVRGSMPVFFTQPGIKYKPPPRLEKDEDETRPACEAHFEEQTALYRRVVIINLVEQVGREDIIGQAFMKQVLLLDSPLLTYVTFDFHDYCRGLKFENVSVLIDSIRDIIKDMRFCWIDGQGVILEQRSVFRVNCMDCLDRTNVVQTALARAVLSMQLRKLGILLPDQRLPPTVKQTYQDMWASNGDIISRQYAGTAALKGDYTRTGERKFTGMMRDGYHSANRYLQNQFKDAYKQVTIDLMLGNEEVLEDLSVITEQKVSDEEAAEEVWSNVKEENITQLTQHCLKLLVPKHEVKHYIGGWVLINCDPIDPEESDEEDRDVILLITEKAYYIANYDDEAEKITQYERINIEDMEAIGIGSAAAFFSNTKDKCIRVYHSFCGDGDYFHTLKVLPGRNKHESDDILHNVIEAFARARSSNTLGLKVIEDKMERKARKVPQELIKLTSQKRLTMWLQDKFVPEMVIKKHSEPRDRQPRRPASRPGPRTAAVSRYLQSVSNKVTNLNLIQRARNKKKNLGNVPHTLIYQKSTDSDATEEDGSVRIDCDRNDVDTYDDFDDSPYSSSTDTSYDALSIGDCLEILGGNIPNYPQENPDDPIMLNDGDIMLPTCGELATDPCRNQRSFKRRHITPRKKHSKGHAAYDDRIVDPDKSNPDGLVECKDADLKLDYDNDRILDQAKQVDKVSSEDGVTNQDGMSELSDSHLPDHKTGIDSKSEALSLHDQRLQDSMNHETADEGKISESLQHRIPEFHDHLPVDSRSFSENGRSGNTLAEDEASIDYEGQRSGSPLFKPELQVSELANDNDEILVTMNPLPEVLPIDLRDLKTAPRSLVTKSPHKSHSENSLADLLAGKGNQEMEKAADVDNTAQTKEEEQTQRKFKNPFRNINLNMNFTRASSIRASQRKAKMLMEMQMRSQNCRTRFLQL
ncbi:phosphatidylinositide phosphatase SAC2-like [Acanthaster planci]|uniref:Phosphatidylinositide phosphatase SAC2-like n=1 Tax=Acanthaster planci TaxID=133434 RepID=A0A8B7XJ14_ACAPL|nr:phosphatidylinositide phosphatase SAC2-like [Acanthaster planci]